MTDDRKSGITLIAGSLSGVLTMAIHPESTASLTADQAAHLALTSGIAHSLAMVSFVLMFLGACGLVKRIASADRIAFAALVTFGFACVAVLIATAVSGFVIPGIMRMMVRDVPAALPQWRIVIAGIFQINQAFSRIYAVATSAAIILWSVSAFRNGGLGRSTAIYGCVTAPLAIVGIATGHLRLDVHGMTAVVLAHTIWFIAAGVNLQGRNSD
jgi:hypothetical protein